MDIRLGKANDLYRSLLIHPWILILLLLIKLEVFLASTIAFSFANLTTYSALVFSFANYSISLFF